ncbi:MAG: serine hydrolase domain-containing protein [Bacteroidota bacterium]
MHKMLFILLLSSFSFGTALFGNDSLKIQSAVEAYLSETGFSGTVLVAKSGESIFHQSYGLAYRATPDTIQNNYHYSIASITKLFTSIRILQLVEAGQLDLFTPVIAYLPMYRGLIKEEVCPHHLLLHLSGLPEEKNRFFWFEKPIEELTLGVLKKGKKEAFNTFNYNNIDYILLGLLIEEVTGKSWEENIQTYILNVLGLQETGFLAYGDYPEDFAYPYSQKGKSLKQDRFFQIENFYAAGCMYSTSEDLLRLDQALYTDQLLLEKGRELLGQSFPEVDYVGYSVWNYRYPFLKEQPQIMERRGGIQGTNVVLVRLLEQKYTVIILSNDDRFNPDSFGDPTNLREKLIQALF